MVLLTEQHDTRGILGSLFLLAAAALYVMMLYGWLAADDTDVLVGPVRERAILYGAARLGGHSGITDMSGALGNGSLIATTTGSACR